MFRDGHIIIDGAQRENVYLLCPNTFDPNYPQIYKYAFTANYYMYFHVSIDILMFVWNKSLL